MDIFLFCISCIAFILLFASTKRLLAKKDLEYKTKLETQQVKSSSELEKQKQQIEQQNKLLKDTKNTVLSENPYLDCVDAAISETFKIQEEADRAIVRAENWLKQQTDKIDLDKEPLEFWIAQLSELVLVERLIFGLGLAKYRDEIMSAVIAANIMPQDKNLAPAAPLSLLKAATKHLETQEIYLKKEKESKKPQEEYVSKSKRNENKK